MNEALTLWKCVNVYKRLKSQLITCESNFQVLYLQVRESRSEEKEAQIREMFCRRDYYTDGIAFFEAVLETEGLLEVVRKLSARRT